MEDFEGFGVGVGVGVGVGFVNSHFGLDTFAPLGIEPVDTPVVTAEETVADIGIITIIAVIGCVAPLVCVTLGSLFYTVGVVTEMRSDGVFPAVVEEPPLFLNALLENRP